MDPERLEQIYSRFVERWDYNEDGQATCEDIAVKRSRLFQRLDEDKDGALSSGEYRYAKFEDKSFLFFPYDRVDMDSSTTIDVEEFVAVSHSEFLNIDKDKDCTINRQEAMMAMRETMGSGREGGRPGGRGKGGKGGRGGPPPGGGMGGPMATDMLTGD